MKWFKHGFMMNNLRAKLALVAFSLMPSLGVVNAAEPTWSPIVIPTGEYREQIKSMPIEQRPYRPLHFYGNTVRRNHYRGNPVATPRDLGTTAGQLMRRR
jgi:hypothetical protein